MPPIPDSLEEGPTATQQTTQDVDWLRNVLTVTGPMEEMHRFRSAASGAGVIPWVLDLAGMEEDWFLSMASPPDGARAISVQGAKILARRLRDAVAANHGRANARIEFDRSCPFDLQRLLPVPPGILCAGPDDPTSLAWLRTHWGTERALRHVRELEPTIDGRKRRMAELRVEFWSADWSPWQAVRRLRRNWPVLIFDLQPNYGGGEHDRTARDAAVPAEEKKRRRERQASGIRVAKRDGAGRG